MPLTLEKLKIALSEGTMKNYNLILHCGTYNIELHTYLKVYGQQIATGKQLFERGWNLRPSPTFPILIFSNCEPFFMGIRVAVKEKVISHEDVLIVYTSEEGKQTEITIDENGRLSEQPVGMFDALDEGLIRLLAPYS